MTTKERTFGFSLFSCNKGGENMEWVQNTLLVLTRGKVTNNVALPMPIQMLVGNEIVHNGVAYVIKLVSTVVNEECKLIVHVVEATEKWGS